MIAQVFARERGRALALTLTVGVEKFNEQLHYFRYHDSRFVARVICRHIELSKRELRITRVA